MPKFIRNHSEMEKVTRDFWRDAAPGCDQVAVAVYQSGKVIRYTLIDVSPAAPAIAADEPQAIGAVPGALFPKTAIVHPADSGQATDKSAR